MARRSGWWACSASATFMAKAHDARAAKSCMPCRLITLKIKPMNSPGRPGSAGGEIQPAWVGEESRLPPNYASEDLRMSVISVAAAAEIPLLANHQLDRLSACLFQSFVHP